MIYQVCEWVCGLEGDNSICDNFFKKTLHFFGHNFANKKKPPTFATPFEKRAVLCFKLLIFGGVPEWPNGADCKSAGVRLRWFESIRPHNRFNKRA